MIYLVCPDFPTSGEFQVEFHPDNKVVQGFTERPAVYKKVLFLGQPAWTVQCRHCAKGEYGPTPYYRVLVTPDDPAITEVLE